MDNQHRKIKGYRELSQEDIDLMNRIKATGELLLNLQAELMQKLSADKFQKLQICETLYAKAEGSGIITGQSVDASRDIDLARELAEADSEIARFDAAEPFRWAAIGKTDIQTGVMALVRAVAQPESC